jgi:ferrous-iron efflux pump FieF
MDADTPTTAPITREQQARLLRLATNASVAVALTLIAAKGLAWSATGAVSLLAALLDSVLDAAASLLNLFAVRYALAPADREHRFGHGKAESLAALGQAMLIIVSGLFLVRAAIARLADPQPVAAIDTGVAVLLFSIVATLGLVTLQRYVIRRTHSAAIRADALHYQVDLLSNGAVLVAIGLAHAGWHMADPLLALGIAVYLLLSTRAILAQALNELLDRELPEAQRQAIIAAGREHPQVLGVHDVRTRRSGRTEIVQMHIELDGSLPLDTAHGVAVEVEEAIKARLPNADIVIHQDPVGVREPRRWTQD